VTSRIVWFVGGALAAIALSIGFVAWSFHRMPSSEPSEEWRTAGPVAVSSQWSVLLEEQESHPFLAEYNYRLRVFFSDDRDGEPRGTVDLHGNTGGRTSLCLYRLTSPGGEVRVEVVDRIERSIVDLDELKLLPDVPRATERLFLGEFLESAPPLRFVPARPDSVCPWQAPRG